MAVPLIDRPKRVAENYRYTLTVEAAQKLGWLRDMQYLLLEQRRRNNGKGTHVNASYLMLVNWLYRHLSGRMEKEALRLGLDPKRIPRKKWEIAAKPTTTAPPKTDISERT